MIAPPSKELLETLLKLRLCTVRDLKRCRPRVRRLTRDLPVFDSVWIDALLQARKLTSFQARILQSSDSQQLLVGPCVLVDRLGHGPQATTYLARRREGNERCVLKIINRPAESIDNGLKRLEELVDQLKGFDHPAMVGPHSCLGQQEQLITISRYVPGQIGRASCRERV